MSVSDAGTGFVSTSIGRAATGLGILAALAVLGVGPSGEPSRAAETASTHHAPLDGTTFRAGIVRVGSEEDGQLEDRLTFTNGMFSSAICANYNFVEAPYWVRVDGDLVHFLAELTSPTDGTMVWQGTIRGDTLEGTMRWTKERWYWTIDTEHRIRGQLQEVVPDAQPASD